MTARQAGHESDGGCGLAAGGVAGDGAGGGAVPAAGADRADDGQPVSSRSAGAPGGGGAGGDGGDPRLVQASGGGQADGVAGAGGEHDRAGRGGPVGDDAGAQSGFSVDDRAGGSAGAAGDRADRADPGADGGAGATAQILGLAADRALGATAPGAGRGDEGGDAGAGRGAAPSLVAPGQPAPDRRSGPERRPGAEGYRAPGGPVAEGEGPGGAPASAGRSASGPGSGLPGALAGGSEAHTAGPAAVAAPAVSGGGGAAPFEAPAAGGGRPADPVETDPGGEESGLSARDVAWVHRERKERRRERRARRNRHILKLRSQGQSIRSIARELGTTPKAIRRLLRRKAKKKTPKPSLLDPFRPLIRKLVLEDELTAERVLEEIKATGYGGGYTILKEDNRTFRPKASRRPHERFETEPGEQGQVDLSFYTVVLGLTPTKVVCFSMIFGFSRWPFLRFLLHADARSICHCHVLAFQDR